MGQAQAADADRPAFGDPAPLPAPEPAWEPASEPEPETAPVPLPPVAAPMAWPAEPAPSPTPAPAPEPPVLAPPPAARTSPPPPSTKGAPPARRGGSSRVLLVAVAALIVLALVGLGAVKLRGALTPPATPTRVVSHPTQTPQGTPTAVPTMPNFKVPNGKIAFGYNGDTSATQVCASTAALPPLTFALDNSGNVAVDWWVEVKQTLPDGKTLWTGTAPPYSTLPAGQSVQLQLQPDAGLCGQLIGHHGTMQYSATVYYGGGTGAFTISDTITPPPPGTATPTPTVPPTR